MTEYTIRQLVCEKSYLLSKASGAQGSPERHPCLLCTTDMPVLHLPRLFSRQAFHTAVSHSMDHYLLSTMFYHPRPLWLPVLFEFLKH